MKKLPSVRALSLTLIVGLSSAAQAKDADLVVTAGGGYGGVFEPVVCLDEQPCGGESNSGTLLMGAGLFKAARGGARGGLRLEGALAFGDGRGHYADLLGIVGWEGNLLIVEGGLGAGLFWSVKGETRRELGGLLHSGAGVRWNPSVAVLARADILKTERMYGVFLGLAIEWLPLHGS
jgi:hypothetical protein